MLKKKEFNNRIVITFGVIMTFVGLVLLSNNYLQSKICKAYNEINLQVLALNDNENISKIEQELSQEENNVMEEDEVTNEVVETKPPVTKPKVEYIGSLSIPKLSFEHGLTAMDSKYNNVNYGIEIVAGSDYPDVSKGNLILASHSGTSYVSYFRNLYKLNVDDICIVTYKGKEYKYKITKIYNKPKIGKITIDRDYNKNTLTLVTCTKNSKIEQTIYIGELI